jgi:hypothetical protein
MAFLSAPPIQPSSIRKGEYASQRRGVVVVVVVVLLLLLFLSERVWLKLGLRAG